MKKHPGINHIHKIAVATMPCTKRWDDMKGSDLVRACNVCGRKVYDTTTLDEAGLLDLITEFEGYTPKQVYRRNDGTIQAGHCTATEWDRPLRIMGIFQLVGTLLAVSLLLLCGLFTRMYGNGTLY